jgi:hypothetical protein
MASRAQYLSCVGDLTRRRRYPGNSFRNTASIVEEQTSKRKLKQPSLHLYIKIYFATAK